MIRCLKSARCRTFLLYTTSLINSHAKKSNGVKSGDLGGQAVGPSGYNTSRADKRVAKLQYRLECSICRATTAAHIEVFGRA